MKKITLLLITIIMTMLTFGCSEEWMMALNGTRVMSEDSTSQSGSRWAFAKSGSYEDVTYPSEDFEPSNADESYIRFDSSTITYNGTQYSYTKSDNKYELYSSSSKTVAAYTFYITKQTDSTLITYWASDSRYRAFVKTSEYTITYNANGGSYSSSIKTKTDTVAVVKGGTKKITISSTYSTGLTRTDYKFLGWAKSSSAKSADYEAGDSMSVSSNVTLYAVWAKEYVYVTFYDGDTKITSSYNPQKVQTGSSSSYLNSASRLGLSKKGYAMIGWATTKGSSTVAFTDGGSTYKIADDISLYAVWGKNPTVTFNANGGTIGDVTTQVVTYNFYTSLYSAETLGISREGYLFAGWAKTSSATTVAYNDTDNVMLTSDTTLYAVWRQAVTITFDANGGSFYSDNPTQIIPKSTSTSLYTKASLGLNRSGYTFKGWSATSTATYVTYTDGDSVSFSSDTTLYAVWEKNNVIPTSSNLTPDAWTSNYVSSSGSRIYYFYGYSGTTYYVFWDDSYQGSGSYTTDVKVSAGNSSSNTTYYFTATDSGYNTPKKITPTSSGNIYIKIEPYSSSGTFAIAVATSSTDYETLQISF